MELTRHNLDIYHIIHPQLLVRRDVTGQLREVVGRPATPTAGTTRSPSPGCTSRSTGWRAEPARLARRPAARAGRRPGGGRGPPADAAAALRLAASSARGPRTKRQAADAETEALLRWLADDHFTFLGYREYDLVEGPDGMALRAVPGTGLGILRHDKTGSASFATLPPEVRARAKEPHRLILTKANSRSTVHRPVLPRLHRDQEGRARTARSTGSTGSSACTRHDAYPRASPASRCCGASWRACLSRRAWPRTATTARTCRDPGGIPAGGAVPDLGGGADPDRAGRAAAARPHRQTRLFLRKDVYGRFMSCLVYLPGTGTTPAYGCASRRYCGEALHGVGGRLQRHGRRVRAGPAARGGARRPGTMLPDVDADALERRLVAAARILGRGPAAEAAWTLGEERARRPAQRLRGRDPGDLQGGRGSARRADRPHPGR